MHLNCAMKQPPSHRTLQNWTDPTAHDSMPHGISAGVTQALSFNMQWYRRSCPSCLDRLYNHTVKVLPEPTLAQSGQGAYLPSFVEKWPPQTEDHPRLIRLLSFHIKVWHFITEESGQKWSFSQTERWICHRAYQVGKLGGLSTYVLIECSRGWSLWDTELATVYINTVGRV